MINLDDAIKKIAEAAILVRAEVNAFENKNPTSARRLRGLHGQLSEVLRQAKFVEERIEAENKP